MKVLIAGDFAQHDRLDSLIKDKRFAEIFPDDLCNLVKSADLSFVNFENPVAGGHSTPIPKCGPSLRCTPEAIEAVSYVGFTGVTMANNHIMDYGVEGLMETIKCCRVQGLDIVGVGDSLKDARKVLYLENKGKTIAIINCCEHEFSIATENEAGANPLNPVNQFYAIQEAKNKADYTLVIVHGGHEMFQLPSPRMVETYRFFIDAGADAVINHHQHCYSGFEFYQGRPICYGLGNFCFDWDNRHSGIWTEGYCVVLDLCGNEVTLELHPYIQCTSFPRVHLLNSNVSKDFFLKIDELNSIIADDKALEDRVYSYYLKGAKYEIGRLEPYSKAWELFLYNRGLLPKYMDKNKRLSVLGHVMCEAHRDKLIYVLKTTE